MLTIITKDEPRPSRRLYTSFDEGSSSPTSLPTFSTALSVSYLGKRINQMHGNERVAFENAANLVRLHTWFVEPFVKASENDALLDALWLKASGETGISVELSRTARTYVGSFARPQEASRELTGSVAEITPVQCL